MPTAQRPCAAIACLSHLPTCTLRRAPVGERGGRSPARTRDMLGHGGPSQEGLCLCLCLWDLARGRGGGLRHAASWRTPPGVVMEGAPCRLCRRLTPIAFWRGRPAALPCLQFTDLGASGPGWRLVRDELNIGKVPHGSRRPDMGC